MNNILSKKILFSILTVLVAISVVFVSIPIIQKIQLNKKIEQTQAELSEYEKIKNTEGMQALKTLNDDFFAWLYVNDVKISLPVVTETEKDFYLSHNLKKEYNVFGTPYIPLNMNESSENIVVVGHSVFENSNGYKNIIFGNLEQYLTDKNEYAYSINLETLSSTKMYNIISIFTFDSSNIYHDAIKIYQTAEIETQEKLDEFCQILRNLSIKTFDFEANLGDQFISLFTCMENNSRDKIMIVAKLV